MATNYRVPRGFAVRHPQYQEIMEGMRPTIKDLKAAPYLPVAEIEPRHDDPIVIPAGTWVGIVQGTSGGGNQADVDTGQISRVERYLVPAYAQAYQLEYTSNDISSTFGTLGNVPDIDDWSATDRTGVAVSAAGASTKFIGQTGVGIKPIGIAFHDIYASWLGTAHINYDRQPNITVLTRDYVIHVPAVTPNEKLIEPGDLVAIDGHGTALGTWAPGQSNTGQYKVGRLIAVKSIAYTGTTNTTGAFLEANKISEFVVGRCLRKILIAEYSSASENALLSTTVATAGFTRSHVSVEFADNGRVQTVPGLSLQGSGIKGVPAYARTATADANKRFWMLEIHVSVC